MDSSLHSLIPTHAVTSTAVTDDLGLDDANTRVAQIEQQFSETGVPEPASLAILGVSLLGMGAFRRLRK